MDEGGKEGGASAVLNSLPGFLPVKTHSRPARNPQRHDPDDLRAPFPASHDMGYFQSLVVST